MPRRPVIALVAGLAAALAGATAPGALAGPSGVQNPCLDPSRGDLLCPDLQMSDPFDLEVDREERRGRTLLRAGNSINNVGLGPAWLRGRRTSARWMEASQLIQRRSGKALSVDTGARLFFKHIPRQGRYWKLWEAAAFELWRLDEQGERTRRVRSGPKVVYCLRDLERTVQFLNSPRRRVFPACSQSSRAKTVTLGTSVGWSDIYPASYPEQWLDVTGLHGCFDYVHIADPRNSIVELDETNNEGSTTVQLPYRPDRGAGSCPSSTRPGDDRPPQPPDGIEDYDY